MKAGKIILSLVGIIAVVIAVAVWYLLSNLNSIVKTVVEDVGSEVLQTPVTLGKVDIKLVEGSGELGQFAINNYEGFKEPKLLSFDKVLVNIDPASVTGDVIVIDELTISGVSIVAEQLGKTTNLQTLLSKLPKGEEETAVSESSSTSSEIKLAVKKLSFIDNSMSLATEKYGKHTLDLPKIVRENLGSASNGLTPEQLGKEIVKPLIESAKKRVEKGISELAEKELKERYGDKVEEEKEKLKGQLEDKLGEGAEEKLKNLKKLF